LKRTLSQDWHLYADLIPAGAEARAQQWLDAFPDAFESIDVAPEFHLNDKGWPESYAGALKTLIRERDAYVAFLVSDVLVDGSIVPLAPQYAEKARYSFDQYFREHQVAEVSTV